MTTLTQARAELRENMEKGMDCPCCTQYVKLYKRSMTASMACALIYVYRYFERHGYGEPLHVGQYLNALDLPGPVRSTGDFAKLRFWGLVEYVEGTREDGSNRNGYFYLTQEGKAFVEGRLHVPRRVYIFNNKCYGKDTDTITIQDALKNKFNYTELMA